jgi:hypothetical protein
LEIAALAERRRRARTRATIKVGSRSCREEQKQKDENNALKGHG